MNVIVDATVWSLAFRRPVANAAEADVLADLLRKNAAILIGPIRQEVLSGIKDPKNFRSLRDELRKTADYPIEQAHYEAAAEGFNICRAKGVQGSHTDFLVCAVAQLDRLPIFSADKDFEKYSRYLPITLFVP